MKKRSMIDTPKPPTRSELEDAINGLLELGLIRVIVRPDGTPAYVAVDVDLDLLRSFEDGSVN